MSNSKEIKTSKSKTETQEVVMTEKQESKEVKVEKVEIKTETPAKKLLSKDEYKAQIRRGQFASVGRLGAIDTSKFDKDYVYRVVNDTPGKIEDRLNLGYEFALDHGDDQLTVNDASGLGAKKQIEVGKYKGSVKAYLMRCPRALYEARKEVDRENDSKRFESAKKENQRTDQQDK